MLKWKIWFWDYRAGEFVTVTNQQATLRELPILAVVCIANIRRDRNGIRRWVEKGQNHYCYMLDQEWWGVDYDGLRNYLDAHRGTAAVLFGGMVDNYIYQQAYELAKNDPDILAVTQYYKER